MSNNKTLADIHDMLYAATGIPGNAAAMREALELITRMTDTNPGHLSPIAILTQIGEVAEAALAAPARNCDKYADEDDAFAAWHDSLKDGDIVSVRNAFYWLFANAKGGAE